MSKTLSFPCPFCTHTAEKKKNIRGHIFAHHARSLVLGLKAAGVLAKVPKAK